MEKLTLQEDEQKKLENMLSSYSKLIKITISPKIENKTHTQALAIARRRSSECLKYLHKYNMNESMAHRLENLLMPKDAISYLLGQVRELKIMIK